MCTLPLCLSARVTGVLAPGAAKPKAGLGLPPAAERAAAAAAGALRSATAASDAAKAVPGLAPLLQRVAAGAAGERLRADAAGVLGARPHV